MTDPRLHDAADTPPPPVAERRPEPREAHGTTWSDDYAWLRAKRWERCVTDPAKLPREIRAHLEAENAHAKALFAPLAALRETLVAELRGRIDPVDVSLPDDDGPWTYIERLADGDEHGIYARRPRGEGGEECVLIDFEAESAEADCFDVGTVEPSPDHRHLAWTVDTDGAELHRLLVRDAGSLEDIVEIEDVGDVCWVTPKVLLYTRLDEHMRPSSVWRHVLGTDPDEDVPVHEEADPRFDCSVWTSRSRAYVFLAIETSDSAEVWFVPTSTPFADPTLIEPRGDAHEYTVEHQGDRFLILTNADGATDFRLVETPCATPGRAHWSDVVPHVPGRTLLDVEAYRDWLFWSERENALPRIRWRRTTDAAVDTGTFDVDEPAYSLSLEPLIEYTSDSVRIGLSSPTTPETVFGVDLGTGERTALKTERIPSGHDPARYRAARVHATSDDGSRVPITLLHLADTPLDGTAPCLLNVYGAYGDGVPAAFDAGRLPLVERGFVVATAHVRGGDECGRDWYEASRFGGRERVVEDLIAVAEHLVASDVCARGRICLEGASAGGLVVGAALNRAAAGEAGADLWGAAILDVPFVDALNTMLDDTLPLTPAEWSEWGNPIEDAGAFANIRRHAPYENVASGDYPPLLVTAGVADTRVTWWEPAKWVARLRERRANDTPIALFTNLSTGHFGESGRYASLDEEARALAFAIATVG